MAVNTRSEYEASVKQMIDSYLDELFEALELPVESAVEIKETLVKQAMRRYDEHGEEA